MNTLDTINNRRSCKQFDPDKLVSQDLIEKICDAGSRAANGKGLQAGKILVINNKEDRNLIVKKNAEILGNPDIDPFYGAPQIICVLANKNVNTYIYDGSLIMGNMMLAAEELGVASCWIHRAKQFFNLEEGKALLAKANIDEDFEGIGNLAIGYPAGERRPDPKIKEDFITWLN